MEEEKRQLFRKLRKELGDDRIIRAMEQVPRECFVPPMNRHAAYEDMPLPIGEDQTISQPYIVALMTKALELKETDKVLELGTGSGYQAAVLSHLTDRVISVERIPTLAYSAEKLLDLLDCKNVQVYPSGMALGLPEEAPYDAILATAGCPRLPKGLLEQLAVDGRMVLPIGLRQGQILMKVTKTKEGYSIQTMGACRFVPMIGEEAWPEEQSDGSALT